MFTNHITYSYNIISIYIATYMFRNWYNEIYDVQTDRTAVGPAMRCRPYYTHVLYNNIAYCICCTCL